MAGAKEIPIETDTESIAFEQLALPHLGAVARFALALTRDLADADDLTQDTFLKARRSWHTFDRQGECRKWLFAICRNAFLSGRRRLKWSVESTDGDLDALPAVLGHAAAVAAGMGELYDRMDLMPAIQAAIAALPEPHHSIMVLVDIEGESYQAAAEILGIPVGTVRSRLFRARRQVQDDLIAFGQDAGFVTGVGRGGRTDDE